MSEHKYKPLYRVTGAAKDYCDYAIELYNGCSHGCAYCYARTSYEKRHCDCVDSFDEPYILYEIYEAVEKQLSSNIELYCGKTVFLGFYSDLFPKNYCDIKAVERMVRLLKKYGCHITILTKGCLEDCKSVIDRYLTEEDTICVSISCGKDMADKYEPYAATPEERLSVLKYAHKKGVTTRISFEPVLEPDYVYSLFNLNSAFDLKSFVDVVEIGKLNHMTLAELTGNPEDVIDWCSFGHRVVELCERYEIPYIIKSSLKAYMQKGR